MARVMVRAGADRLGRLRVVRPLLHEARQASVARAVLHAGLGACGIGDGGTVD